MMKIGSVLLLLGMIGAALGVDAEKPVPPLTTWETTMPAIELSNQPLEKVLAELKKKLPGFYYSVSRENVPHDYPVLPKMSLENVSIGRFMDLVQQEIPGVQINEAVSVEGGGFRDGSHQLEPATGVFCGVSIQPNPNLTHSQEVHVFGLSEIIASRVPSVLRGNADAERKASNDILSLIQAALDADGATGSSPAASLQVHGATQTLIFTGAHYQVDIVANALAALQPSENELHRKLNESIEENARLRAELKKLQSASTQPAK
jgi:hypothetical protein